MPKLSSAVTYFTIDTTEFPKNILKITELGDLVGLSTIDSSSRTIVQPTHWSNWQDNTGAFYASYAALKAPIS